MGAESDYFISGYVVCISGGEYSDYEEEEYILPVPLSQEEMYQKLLAFATEKKIERKSWEARRDLMHDNVFKGLSKEAAYKAERIWMNNNFSPANVESRFVSWLESLGGKRVPRWAHFHHNHDDEWKQK